MTLTLKFSLSLKTLTLLNQCKSFDNSTQAFLVKRPVHGYQHFLLWPWHCRLANCIVNNVWRVSARALIYHMSISCDKLVSKYLSMWPWPSLELVIIWNICVSQTPLVHFIHLKNKHFSMLFSEKNNFTYIFDFLFLFLTMLLALRSEINLISNKRRIR